MRQKILKSNKGGAAVLLTIAFACMVLLSSCLFIVAKHVAGRSYADAALRTAGRSVMSEYDKKLLSDYGLFAFHSDERQIARDIAFYANASLKKNKLSYTPLVSAGKKISVFDIGQDASDIDVNLKEYSIMNVDIFEQQVKDAAITEWIGNRVKPKSTDAKGGAGAEENHRNRTLRDPAIIDALPSAGLTGFSWPNLTAGDVPGINEIADKTSTKVLVDEYILAVFNRSHDDYESDDTFFDSEVEYILSGKMSEASNKSSVMNKIRAMRFALNNVAILTDPLKMSKVVELAAPAALIAGVGELVAQAFIIEVWATAETENDISLLEDGEKVALYKSHNQWALSNIVAILGGELFGEAVKPKDSSGQDYKTYLRVLLFTMDREAKLLRMMDLIQINMKGTYNRSFTMREYYTGYRFKAEIKGDSFEYTQRY
jgi:hypothetical protein